MLVMFCFMLIGFLLKKLALLPDNADKVFSKLENYVLVPALVIDTFMTNCHIGPLMQEANLIMYSLILLAAALAISLPLSKVFARGAADENYQRSIYKYALTFGNFSFMGNAVVLGVLGDSGLFSYLLFTLPLNIAVYTWGVMILVPQGEEKGGTLKNLFNPIFVSLILGMILGLLEVGSHLPKFITSTISGAKSCMGPIAMILTGFVIGGYNIRALLAKKRIYIAALLRLIVIPSAMLGALRFFGVGADVLTPALFAFATPLGLNTVVFPAAYGGDTETGASMAMISHTLSVITIPLMYGLFIVTL